MISDSYLAGTALTDFYVRVELDFLHLQILKARRTWSMTSFGMKTRREGTQVM
ncbi:hypothetical protein Hdeb2414_s0003g00085561 [Helianthus debilis subsp. tardiflorus]